MQPGQGVWVLKRHGNAAGVRYEEDGTGEDGVMSRASHGELETGLGSVRAELTVGVFSVNPYAPWLVWRVARAWIWISCDVI